MEAVDKKLPPKGTQGRLVYEYMKLGHSISSVQAIEEFRILRLPNRISELRNKYGIKIYQRSCKSKSNKRVRWEEYSLTPFDGEE